MAEPPPQWHWQQTGVGLGDGISASPFLLPIPGLLPPSEHNMGIPPSPRLSPPRLHFFPQLLPKCHQFILLTGAGALSMVCGGCLIQKAPVVTMQQMQAC